MNNEKRRDAKGRVLRSGESQQRDGRYRYTYYVKGRQHCFYSWKLEDTDRVPSGKHPCKSLRSQIKELNKSREQGIAFRGNDMSVLDLVEKYLAIQNANDKIRTSTKAGYRTSLKHIREDSISSVRIDKVRKSDAKRWITSLKENGFGYSTISSIHGVMKPAFQMAVDDDLILKNPFDFVMTDVVANDSAKREALTSKEKDSFLEFIKRDSYYKQYYDAIVILFETGLRVAEFCGLTSDKIDMEKRMIKIDVQLHKDRQGYYLEKPKTTAGIRTVPMTDRAYESFCNLLQNRTSRQEEKNIAGQKKYICFDRNDSPRYGSQWDKIFENIWKKYNQSHETTMVKVTPHICRHTFATSMAINGMNPAILKQIMGHDDISTTFSIYTHIKGNDSMDEFIRLGLVNMDTEPAEKDLSKDSSEYSSEYPAKGNPKIIDFESWIA